MKRWERDKSLFVTPFQRENYDRYQDFTYIGDGDMGAKAVGLAIVKENLAKFCLDNETTRICVDIPRLTVITTSCFEWFMKENGLYEKIKEETDDEDIVRQFLAAKLPPSVLEDLKVLTGHYDLPLTVRPSGVLEDRLISPFAGVYKARMLPNNHPDATQRLEKLCEAIKFVYASVFFKDARLYFKSGCRKVTEEKLAIIIQEVVGERYEDRFYPNISGVASSYNYYPAGHARPSDGVVNLALGLGKAIIDGGAVWTYSPKYPEINPPFPSMNEMLEQTQLDFWAIDMTPGANQDVTAESGYLKRLSISDAEKDNTLGFIASTYDYDADRIDIGIGFRGSRVLDFAPLLKVDLLPVNQLVQRLLAFCEEANGAPVEIHFALTFDLSRERDHLARLGLLQVRSLASAGCSVDLDPAKWTRENSLAASHWVLGNGCVTCIKDVVYVKPEHFSLKNTEDIAIELDGINRRLVELETPYLLIGFGRWGTSDPWLGIPVGWKSISGARVIVESFIKGIHVEMSQGFHFYHKLCNLKLLYFCLEQKEALPVDFDWLNTQETMDETTYVRHVRLERPLSIQVDGRHRRGVIFK